MDIARRDFLKGSAAVGAVAGAAALGMSSLAGAEVSLAQEPSDTNAAAVADADIAAAYDALDPSTIEELEADLVVIGAGPSGMAAAITAAEAGLTVAVLEKTSVSGGCAKFGMGPLAIGSKYQKAQGEELDLDDMFEQFCEYTHFRTNAPLVRHYLENSVDTLDWLESMGVQFDEAARYFDKSYPTWHLVHSETGVVGGGQAKTMTDHMEVHATELGVTFYFSTPAVKLELEDGKVAGVCATDEDATKGYHFTTKAAVVATGGFDNSASMVKEQLGLELNQNFFGNQFPGHEGDGVNMVWAVGGKHSTMVPETIYDIFRPDNDSDGNWTFDIKLVVEQANLLVNREGRRFMNEEQIQNTTYCGNALFQQTDNTGFMICDEDIKNGYVSSNSVPLTSKVWNTDDFSHFDENFAEMEATGYNPIQRADTLEELAEKFGIDPEGLAATVEEYNRICEEGHDPLGKPAEYLQPIKTAPFYAAQFYPSAYGTLGGVKINELTQVIDANDQVIPGLFSCGTDSCTIYGDSYMFLLPGNTMGYSLNTGRFAGDAAVTYIQA